MKNIVLSRGLFTSVDDEDFEYLNQWNWHVISSSVKGLFYAARNIYASTGKRTALLMHRALMVPPGNLQVDHIDGDGLNNRRNNLRIATPSQNLQNQNRKRLHTSSRYKGVHWSKQANKWNAMITYGGSARHLGLFSSEKEAALAYDVAARKRFGEFAACNFNHKTQNSVGFKQKLRIGAQLRDALEPHRDQATVAALLGISQQAVSKIERLALYKVSCALQQLRREEKIV